MLFEYRRKCSFVKCMLEFAFYNGLLSLTNELASVVEVKYQNLRKIYFEKFRSIFYYFLNNVLKNLNIVFDIWNQIKKITLFLGDNFYLFYFRINYIFNLFQN